MSRIILGLDLRHDAVSAAVLNSGLRESEVEDFIHIPIMPGDDMAEAVSLALGRIRSKMDISKAACAAAFPAQWAFCRNIRLPFKENKRIAQVLPFELETVMPFPVEGLITDFHVMAPSGPEDQTDIIAVSVKETDLGAGMAMLMSAGMEPETVSIGGYSAAHCLSMFPDTPDHVMLLDVSRDQAVLFLIRSKEICLIRPLLTASTLDALGQAIRQTLAAVEDPLLLNYPVPGVLYLTGHGLNGFGEEFHREMETRTGIPVKLLNIAPIAGVRVKSTAVSPWKPHEMNNALALALAEADGKTGLDFRKGAFSKGQKWAVHKKILSRVAIFSLIILAMFCADIQIDCYLMQKKISRLDEQINGVFQSALPEVTKIVDPLHQMRTAIEDRRKETLTTPDTLRIIEILNELSTRIPDKTDVKFVRLVIDPGSLLISGDTDAFNSVDGVQTQIEGIQGFKKVTIISTEIDKKTNRVLFKMKVDI
jgi:hypothetical protein